MDYRFYFKFNYMKIYAFTVSTLLIEHERRPTRKNPIAGSPKKFSFYTQPNLWYVTLEN